MPRLVGQIPEDTTSVFSQRVRKDYLTVDKTAFIRQFLLEASAISLITEPRRFGKSTTFSMLEHFCAATVNGISTQGLFDRFEIANVDGGEFLRKHQGQYPVIGVSFKDIKNKTYGESLHGFRDIFSKLYRQHESLLVSDKLTENDKREFNIYLEGRADSEKLQNALQFLSEFLYKAHGNREVILLIDEYDAPLTSAYEYKFLGELGGFMRNLFSAALKDNPFVHKGLMFGILRVSQSEMLSGLNNLRTYTVLDPTFQEYFGFTEPEVTLLVDHAKTHSHLPVTIPFEEIKCYYNGYKVGETILYNPWSMMQFISQQRLKPYWVLTANDYLLRHVLLGSRAEDKVVFGQLIQMHTIERKIKVNLRYEDLIEDPDALWTLLLFGGYLTSLKQVGADDENTYELKIPNTEVRKQYTDIFTDWLKGIAGGEAKYQAFLEHLISGRIEAFTEELGRFMLEVLSVKDVSGDKAQSERFYHGMMIGLIASLKDKYHILSNREGRLGFYDTTLIPKLPEQEQAIILEFKRCKANQDMVTTAKEALTQINEMHYSANLADYPHVKRVMNVGLAFRDKSVQSAYEERDVASGERIGDISLSLEYGSDEDVVPRANSNASRSRIDAGFLDEVVDEEGYVAGPSVSKLRYEKPEE